MNATIKIKDSKAGPTEIIGVTLGWNGAPRLCFGDGRIFVGSSLDLLFYPEYFPKGKNSWPINPKTGIELPIVEFE